MVEFLMMLAKLAPLGLLKIKVFWNKGYDVIILVYNVANKILLHDSNCIVVVIMCPKFGNSSISMREVIIIPVLQGFDQKKHFSWGVLLAEVQ